MRRSKGEVHKSRFDPQGFVTPQGFAQGFDGTSNSKIPPYHPTRKVNQSPLFLLNIEMADTIPGITRTALWKAWKEVRKNLKNASVRDVIDFLEYDIDPDIWINRSLRQLRDGSYEPGITRRFTLCKSKGFSRTMTFPSIPDLVLYRAVVDQLYVRAKRREHKHVYFERERLSKVTQEAAIDAQQQMADAAAAYPTAGVSRFSAWKRYEQYRKYLIFKRVYPYIVTTDITNFFDSILYNCVADALHGLPVPRRLVGLLFFLLERLSVRETYSESPRIGLPVDEFDCSRKLAHLMLFPHDDRMVALVGEEAYIRWMDDQNIGVESRAEGLKVLAQVGISLGRLHLTPNAEKSRVLSFKDAVRHFHLDINQMLDDADKLLHREGIKRGKLRARLKKIWNKAKKYEDLGEWGKVLKRIYRLAALADVRSFRDRAVDDILRTPDLARRIADYMRCTGSVREYLGFVRKVWDNPEQVYPDVNVVLTETILRLEPNNYERRIICIFASDLLRCSSALVGYRDCSAVAPLILLRFADRRSLPTLRACFANRPEHLSAASIRSAAIVYLTYGRDEFMQVRRVAARLFQNNLAEIVRVVERILRYNEVPRRFGARINSRFDPVAGRNFLDMRGVLASRLLALNRKKPVTTWLITKKRELLDSSISAYDKRLLKRLLPV